MLTNIFMKITIFKDKLKFPKNSDTVLYFCKSLMPDILEDSWICPSALNSIDQISYIVLLISGKLHRILLRE